MLRALLATGLLLAADVAEADLPIHVLLSDIVGTWRFSIGAEESEEPMACGGGSPNMNLENLDPHIEDYYSWLTTRTGMGLTTRLTLTDQRATRTRTPTRKRWSYLVVTLPNSGKQIGTWTMVYDEGFEVRIGKKRFFGLTKYSKAGGTKCMKRLNGDSEDLFGRTKCYATDSSRIQLGWTVKEGRQDEKPQYRWGCFYAERESPADREGSFVIAGHGYGLPSLPVPTEGSPFGHRQGSWVAKHNQFRDTPPEELALYKGHMGYEKFHRKMEYALPTFLQKDNGVVRATHDKPYACDIPVMLHAETASSPLPTEWTWGDPFLYENYDPDSDPVLNQRNCGSCYAVSGVYVLQKRFEILFAKLFPDNKRAVFSSPLSAQTVLSCSPFNQGCDGGYPFLVGKHAKEFGIGTEDCQAYLATHNPADAPCPMQRPIRQKALETLPDLLQNQRHTVVPMIVGEGLLSRILLELGSIAGLYRYAQEYNYVGGFYEGCDEEKIMEEIYNHGPVVAAIDAPDALFLYDDGFFDSKPPDHGKLCDSPRKGFTGWEYTNHAIAIVGWGEDPPRMPGMAGRKFWVVRNTWGNTWGRNGYVKMKRGENLAAIESQAVAIDPDLRRGKAAALVQELRAHAAKASL